MSKLYNALRSPDTDFAAWYLRTNDNIVYGPVTVATLAAWAGQNRVVPGNQVSPNLKEWILAETLPNLKMEWIVTLKDGIDYGPFNVQSVPYMVQQGFVAPDAVLLNKLTGEELPVETLTDADNRQLAIDPVLESGIRFHEPVDKPARAVPGPAPASPSPEPPAAPTEDDAPQLPLQVSASLPPKISLRDRIRKELEEKQSEYREWKRKHIPSDETVRPDDLLEEIRHLTRLLQTERDQTRRLRETFAHHRRAEPSDRPPPKP